MKAFWNKISVSQQHYLIAGAFFIVVFLLFQLVIFPLWDVREKMANSIKINEKALKEMTVLGAEYHVLKQRAEAVQRALAARPVEFSLFSYLEKKAGEIQLKSHIKYINPMKGAKTGAYEESIVEMRLDSMTMKQLTDFILAVESSKDLVRINKISISKMKENPDYLTTTIQAMTYQPLKQATP
jgi:hypothetical protein